MKTAKLFKNGQSQAVRLPKEFRMTGTEVYIKKQGGRSSCCPKKNPGRPFSKAWTNLRRILKSSEINRSKPRSESRCSDEIPFGHQYLHLSH